MGTTRRSAQVPETPTVAETLPGYEASTSSGVLSVARTPAEIINRLNRDLVRIIQGSSFRDKFRADGWEAVGSTPEQYAAHLRDESTRIAATAKAARVALRAAPSASPTSLANLSSSTHRASHTSRP